MSLLRLLYHKKKLEEDKQNSTNYKREGQKFNFKETKS